MIKRLFQLFLGKGLYFNIRVLHLRLYVQNELTLATETSGLKRISLHYFDQNRPNNYR
jgi:hypothetical protein